MKTLSSSIPAVLVLALLLTACSQSPYPSLPAKDEATERDGVIPDMDIEMIYASQISCPSMSATSSSTSGGTTTFAWAPNDLFEVTITGGSATEKFIVKTLDGTGDDPGTIEVYKQGSYSCLTNPTENTTNPKAMVLDYTSFSSPVCTVSGTDNNDGTSSRQVIILHNSAHTVSVKK